MLPLASLCLSIARPPISSMGRGFGEAFVVIILVIIHMLCNSVYCVGVVDDNCNLLLRGMGVRSLPYWLSHLFFDYILYIIRILVFLLVLVVSNNN